MGRRKIPKTSKEFHAELEYTKEQLRMEENRLKKINNKINAEDRKLRTRRLCTEAGVLEHHVPQLKEMSEDDREAFIHAIATSSAADSFLKSWSGSAGSPPAGAKN